jgi:ParB family chromosome partitioning protein
MIDAANAYLEKIAVGSITPNKHNPRIVFRPKEMEELLDSIQQYGIQVPVSVYKEGKRYVLIDGERRWRCAGKLNMRTIPALVQEKPSDLANMLLMFNIHALREQWDLLTIALKLQDVINLMEKDGKERPTEAALSKATGLGRGVIRRCRYLLGLPQEYRDQILVELKKPKAQQKLTEDFFIEMERALRTVERAMPEVIDDKDRIRRTLIRKFEADVIPNRVHFRKMGKIARAQAVDADENEAASALTKLFTDNKYGIEKAFNDSVAEAYQERDTLSRVHSLGEYLDSLEEEEIDEEIRRALQELREVVDRLLEDA